MAEEEQQQSVERRLWLWLVDQRAGLLMSGINVAAYTPKDSAELILQYIARLVEQKRTLAQDKMQLGVAVEVAKRGEVKRYNVRASLELKWEGELEAANMEELRAKALLECLRHGDTEGEWVDPQEIKGGD